MKNKRHKKTSVSSRLVHMGTKSWNFFNHEIWRITKEETSKTKYTFFNIAKTIILSVRFFINDQLQEKASALTYNTMLALVPLLTLMLAISRGFGVQDLIQNQLLEFFPGQEKVIRLSFGFVTNYLEEAKTGIFVGIGLIFLVWVVISLISHIEDVFNHIWRIKRPRPLYRRFTDYLSLILLMPIMMVSSSGLSIFISTSFKLHYIQFLVDPLILIFVRIAPYAITCILLTIIYMVVPNTRVKFKNAFWAGLVAGIAFQLFQYFYINGQIWVARYNAIYGSFAALPLLLLWIHLSWLICLYGAELTYASENVLSYEYDKNTDAISRRYYDFVTLLTATLIVKRFERGRPPITTEEITGTYHIPSKLSRQVLNTLVDTGIINEVVSRGDRKRGWQPAIDINQLSVGYLMEKIDLYGSEEFHIDREERFSSEWSTLNQFRDEQLNQIKDVLLKDLRK